MIVRANSDFIRYTGRWNIKNQRATSTANGSYFEFKFKGDTCVLAFDTEDNVFPYPHLYISVDNGGRISTPVDRYTRISCEYGEHRVMVILKSSSENQERWRKPIQSKTVFLGVDCEEILPLEKDNRKTIEFLGDSITEGISIDVDFDRYFGQESSMVDWDDSTAGYAWLTAKALNLRPYFMAYGCLGVTKNGAGNVPVAQISYKFYSDNEPYESLNADYILINHGTNGYDVDKNQFKKAYIELLEVVRSRNLNSKIICVTPYSGRVRDVIEESVSEFNATNNDKILFIDSTGWIDKEPIHPNRKNHLKVSEKLVDILSNLVIK